MLDQQVAVKRASATREELAARQVHISKQPVQRLTTPPQNQRRRKTAEDQRVGVPMPASQIRYRSLNTEYVIPMTDGSELHVTERELLAMPQNYKDAAIALDDPPIPQAALPMPQVQTDALPRQSRPKRRVHPLLYLGIGMLAMLALWSILLSAIAWYNTTMDDIHFGRPRTFQFDAVVHHNNDSILTPTHLIVINLNRKVEVIEQPAGDSSHMQVYIAATLIEDGSELFPVTAYIKDVTGDGLPDIVLTVKGAHFVLINTGTGFRLAKQGDHISL